MLLNVLLAIPILYLENVFGFYHKAVTIFVIEDKRCSSIAWLVLIFNNNLYLALLVIIVFSFSLSTINI